MSVTFSKALRDKMLGALAERDVPPPPAEGSTRVWCDMMIVRSVHRDGERRTIIALSRDGVELFSHEVACDLQDSERSAVLAGYWTAVDVSLSSW